MARIMSNCWTDQVGINRKVQFRPIDEVVKEMYIRAAKEEGWKGGMEKGVDISAGILRALKEKVPVDKIAVQYNVSTDKIEQFQSVLTP